MGYESRLYIVEKFDTTFYEDNKCYARVISMFNMCKFPALADAMRYKPETNCYFYTDDGNTRVLEDWCGKPLTEATIKSVIDVLEKEIENGECYWRIYPLLATLKSINNSRLGNDSIVVLHYGC